MKLRVSSTFALALALTSVGAACSSGVEDEDGPLLLGGSGGGDAVTGGHGGDDSDCPTALDCDCAYGYFTENDCGGYACNCPPHCEVDAECGEGEFCLLSDCGESLGGYCLESAPDAACTEPQPICGCDGELYPDYCSLLTAQASPTAAPTSDCTVEKVACADDLSCYAETQFCVKFESGSSYCDNFSAHEGCDGASCACIQPGFNDSCICSVNELGLTVMDCSG